MKKRRFLIISVLLVAALMLGIGYAALSRELIIGSTANLSVNQEDFDIILSNPSVTSDGTTASEAATASITANGKGGNYTVTGLSKQNDTVTITFDIENKTSDVTATLTGLSQNPGVLNIGDGTANVGNVSDYFTKEVTVTSGEKTFNPATNNDTKVITIAPQGKAKVTIKITLKQTITETITLDGASVHLNFMDAAAANT